MDGSRARLLNPVPNRVPRLRKAAPPATGAPAAGDRLSGVWSLVLGLGWPLAFMIAVAVEPAPADPTSATPLLVELAGLALVVGIYGTVAAAVCRHPLATVGGVATGLIAAAFSITWPVSGHHGFGLWWFLQIGVILTMLAASVVALGQWTRRPFPE